jgi:hypothetical protein
VLRCGGVVFANLSGFDPALGWSSAVLLVGCGTFTFARQAGKIVAHMASMKTASII